MKKVFIFIVSFVVSSFLLISGSYSWFISTDEAPNEFGMANFGVKLNEVFSEWNQKEVWATNIGEMAALVRIAAVPIVKDKDGNRLDTYGIIEIVRPAKADGDAYDFDEYWYDGQDGWFYYKHLLLPGEETKMFIKRIKLAAGFDLQTHPEYVGATLDADVMMGSAPATSAYTHENIWDVSQNNNLRDLLRTLCDGA